MVTYRVFFPAKVKSKNLSILNTILFDTEIKTNDMLISSVPLEQENVVPAIVIDATYFNPKHSLIYPRYQAHNFGITYLWEGQITFPKRKKRYVTALHPRAEDHLEKIYKQCCSHMHHGLQVCESILTISKGEVPNPPMGQGYGRMVIIETNKREDIGQYLKRISERFAYTIEEKIDMMNIPRK